MCQHVSLLRTAHCTICTPHVPPVPPASPASPVAPVATVLPPHPERLHVLYSLCPLYAHPLRSGGTGLTLYSSTPSSPLLLLPFIPIVLFTWWVSYQYLHVSRELKRLESITKSPVFVLFSETLQGLHVVRAFRDEHRFFRYVLCGCACLWGDCCV
jgi:hypothetical protein